VPLRSAWRACRCRQDLLLALIVPAAGAASFVGAYALVLLLGRAGIVPRPLQSIGIPVRLDHGVPGLVLTTPYPVPLCRAGRPWPALKAVDVSVEEAGQNLGARAAACSSP